VKNSPEAIEYLRNVRKTLTDPLVDHPLYGRFLEFLAHYEDDIHYPRYAYTMAGLLGGLGDRIAQHRDLSICETGDLSLMSRFFLTEGYAVARTTTDLRYAIDRPDASADLVFSFEVLEHIKDQTETRFDELVLFTGSGVARYAAEMGRILKPGGMLVLTTPNPGGVRGLMQLVDGEAPVVYRGHVREYTKRELLAVFRDFELLKYASYFCYFFLHDGATRARELAAKIGWDPDERGDCHFLLLRKPAATA
jgi:SAM-dependent methyltransferase